MIEETENIILEQAVGAFNRETGLRMYINQYENEQTNNEHKFRLDALVGIKGYEPLQYAAEVKKWAQHVNFGAVIDQIRRLPMIGLLVADYVNPNMAEKLREEGIQFIDTAGNTFINAEPLYIYVKGNRNKQETNNKKGEKRRAFTKTGLKVIYALLCDPTLARAPYREIAEKADVALGTVGWVIRDLKEMRYVIDRGNKNIKLKNYTELLDRWVEMYPGILRPNYTLGEFNKDITTDMKTLDPKKYNAYWGGEVAGNKYTGYLRPEIDTIYVPVKYQAELIRELKLFRGGDNRHGIVKLYKPFWKKPENYDGYVHAVLAYADLIATGDARNLETARMIKDEHIRPLWED